MPDGVHKTVEGHRYQANALIPVILDPANGLLPDHGLNRLVSQSR